MKEGLQEDSSSEEKNRILQALKESEEKYRAVAEQSVLGIAIAMGNPLRLDYINDSIEKMLGYDKKEMTEWRGEEVYRIVHPEDQASFFKRFQDRFQNRPVPLVHEFRAVRKNGEIVWFEVYGSRIQYKSETAVLGMFIDITKRRNAQKEVEESTKFNEFLLDLMSHDLNNIHQGMMTGLELLSSRE
ncbi:MAG: PAS domain S-box protein, partial [Candidatus Thorarchaeota archaeon]|nr:PAS domain S-box protein [Candidatus Thorarchaeota archaeon]